MPVASDIILDSMHEDGYSLSEAGWIRPQDRQFYFEVTAEPDGHRHIARGPDRETAVVQIGTLLGVSVGRVGAGLMIPKLRGLAQFWRKLAQDDVTGHGLLLQTK